MAPKVRFWTRSVSLLSLISLPLTSSCGDGGGGTGPNPPPTPVATSISVSPSSVSLVALGATTQFTAQVRDQSGQVMSGASVSWSSSNSSVATVSSTGLGTAASVGSTTITASSGTASGTASLIVTQVVASIVVSPAAHTMIANGETVQLSATVADANGNQVPGATVTWSSNDPNCVQVDANGLATSGEPGTATITATAGGVTDSVEITVLPLPVATVEIAPPVGTIVVGGVLQLTAVPKAAGGNVLTGRAVTWASGNGAIANVNANGLVLGASPGGPVTITATSEGVSGTAQITVIQVPVATVELIPTNAAVVAGGTVQLVATLRDALGNLLTGREMTWASGNGSVASVDPNGLVSGVAPGGPVTITATSEGVSGTAQITVTPAPVATVVVTPANGLIVVGNTLQLVAVAKDVRGNVLSGRVVAWASGNGAVATVNVTGLVSGVSPGGPVTVTATSEGVSGTAQITVTQAPVVPVATIEVVPSSAILAIGDALVLNAILRDASGNTLTGRSVTWTQTRSGVVLGTSAGSQVGLAAVGLGVVDISAWSEGVYGFSRIWVTSPTTCATIAGGEIWSGDNKYLGRLTNQFDTQSILNQFGPYGSQFMPMSIYNPFGMYGSQFQPLSAYNPFSVNPPGLWVRGFGVAYVTKNTFKTPYIDPDVLKTCGAWWPTSEEKAAQGPSRPPDPPPGGEQ